MASSNTLVLYELGSRIKATRIQQGKSQTELAVAVGYDNSALSKIERGERVPDLITMGKIADELKVPMGAWFRPSLTTGTNTDLMGKFMEEQRDSLDRMSPEQIQCLQGIIRASIKMASA